MKKLEDAGGPVARQRLFVGGHFGGHWTALARMRALILEADPEMTEECQGAREGRGDPEWPAGEETVALTCNSELRRAAHARFAAP